MSRDGPSGVGTTVAGEVTVEIIAEVTGQAVDRLALTTGA